MEEDCEELESLSREQQIFEKYPVRKAVAAMAIPTVISQVITVIYNLANRPFLRRKRRWMRGRGSRISRSPRRTGMIPCWVILPGRRADPGRRSIQGVVTRLPDYAV